MQVINTKHYGPITVVKTWAESGGRHIVKLAQGGYAHLSGAPVTLKKDLTDLISNKNDREAAIGWFDHRNDIKPKVDKKRIVLMPNGGYEWEDGSPIDNAPDIYNTLPKGAQLDAVLDWFVRAERDKKVKANLARSGERQATEGFKQKLKSRQATA